MKLSRRELLSRTGFGATLGAAVAFGPRSLLSQLLFEPDAPAVAPHPVPANMFVEGGKCLVAIVQGKDPLAMVSEGLRLLGGVNRLNFGGKRVLVKPNLLNDRPPPTTTNPAVVEAVARTAFTAGASDVIVADSSGMIRFPTRENFLSTGMAAAAERAGARVLALEDETWLSVAPPQAIVMKRFLVSKPVYEAEVILNVPVVKTHRFADYSCSLKNVVGIIHPRQRPSLAFMSGRWHERIAELNLAVHPLLNIADATTMMISGGPTSGTPAEANLLLFSGDRIALDVVALALLRTYGSTAAVMEKGVWDHRQVKWAGEMGLGARGPQDLSIVGTNLMPEETGFTHLLGRIRMDVGIADG